MKPIASTLSLSNGARESEKYNCICIKYFSYFFHQIFLLHISIIIKFNLSLNPRPPPMATKSTSFLYKMVKF